MGRMIRTLLGALFGLVVALLGLLAFKSYTIATPYDDIWVGLNSRMPSPVRAWACQTVEQRLVKAGGPQAKTTFKTPPKGCEAIWN